MKFNGKNILITGGASGLGRLIAIKAIEKQASSIILWDINHANLDRVVNELMANPANTSTKVKGHIVDVSDNDAVLSAFDVSEQFAGQIDILVNCAGIVTSNRLFCENTIDEIDRTFSINTAAPMYVAHAALPAMLRRNCGHICNIASAAGMISNPRMSIYAASKWAVIGWSDSVRIELSEMKSKVRITTVAPYYINTGMFDGVQSRILPILDPQKTVNKIVRAIEKDVDFKGIPFSFHFIRLGQGLLPTKFFDWFFGQVFGIYHTMDNFTGRK
ncbi:MAG: SDR family NAD(P)-dependent oxidoreductase [Candidatus Cryptobacteroides sp.]